MTRHRVAATLFYGRDEFEGRGGLAQALSRPEHKTFSATYEKDALKRLADQRQPVADRPKTLGQRLAARTTAHAPPQANPARERAEAALKIEAAVAARPIGDQARYYDQAVESVAAQRLKRRCASLSVPRRGCAGAIRLGLRGFQSWPNPTAAGRRG
jgi:hypothetical protein